MSIKVGSDFSGVGSFDQALLRLGIEYNAVFACDMDKFARQTYIHNYGQPKYFPENVYNREIPLHPLDIYMTSPPCQAFSLAGKRKGESDKRGILFYNSHEFIQKNKPRYFIFENVKGLLSDAGGLTFRRWIDLLGGKSVNGLPIIFPNEESVPYHVYWKVINAKDHGIPQNRERVFIIGIRDDEDNSFRWPKDEHLTKCLADVLETDVDPKYFLSDKMLDGFKGIDPTGLSRTIRVGGGMSNDDKHNWDLINVGYINQNTQGSSVYSSEGLSQTLCAGTHGYANGYVKVVAFGRSEEEKKRRREHFQKTGKDSGSFKDKELVLKDQSYYNTLLASPNPKKEGLVYLSSEVIQLNQSKESGGKQPYQHNRVYSDRGIITTLDTESGRKSIMNSGSIRRLTPRECFRLMDYPESFTWPVSDSQAYKQAGNSICVGVLARIISKLNLK